MEKGLAKNSIESYARDLGRLAPLMESTGVLDLTPRQLRTFIADLSREGLSPTSVARIVSAVRGFYKFLMIDGHIEKNPAEDLVTPQKTFYLPKFLNQAEIELLFAVPDTSTETRPSRPRDTRADVRLGPAGFGSGNPADEGRRSRRRNTDL